MTAEARGPTLAAREDEEHRKGDDGESDSPYGIFLTGRKLQLQPFDVKAKFVRASDEKGGGTTVWMTGQFKVVDANHDRGPIQVLVVSGEVPVRVDNRAAAAAAQ